MKAEIIAVGTELLMGQIANTNAQYISRQLNELGIDVFYHHVVGDNSARLQELLDKTLKRSDIVITTGGLGPTQDDLTKESIAQYLELEMIRDEKSFQRLTSFFKSMNREITENNLKQAYFPYGSIILENNNGTAPACVIEKNDKIIIVLPGPPRELNPIFENQVKHYLKKKSDGIIVSKMIKIFGVGESAIENILLEIINSQTNPTIATYASDGEVTVRVTAKAKNAVEAQKILEPTVNVIKDKFNNSIYSYENETLNENVSKLLKTNKKILSIAESCTGGMLSSMMIDVPGSSEVLGFSVVTYSDDAKRKILDVSNNTLEQYGAVSKQTVLEMAINIKRISNSDLSIAISGIAGPAGGTEDKPVGLVYICLYDGENNYIKELRFNRERNYNRKHASLYALDMLRRYLTKCL